MSGTSRAAARDGAGPGARAVARTPGLKSAEEVLGEVERRLARTWAADLTADARRALGLPALAQTRPGGDGEAPEAPPAEPGEEAEARAWPHAFSLGTLPTAVIEADLGLLSLTATWREWGREHSVEVVLRARRVHGSEQQLPSHVRVDSLEQAAALLDLTRARSRPWGRFLREAAARAGVLASRYPHLADAARTLTEVMALDEVDFELAQKAADWFAVHDAPGLTPRQVPVPGLHAKWLNHRHGLVAELAGRDDRADLGLLPPHPPRVHVTYLDPQHLAGGGRRHDCATVGDTMRPPYPVSVAVICENKDSALHFPQVPGGVAVEGEGSGAKAVAAIDWLRQAPALFYWGDLDRDGLEILEQFRAAGLQVVSLLMNVPTYRAYEVFGTGTDKRNRPLKAQAPRDTPHLTFSERELYELLCSDTLTGHRRVEQERIPLSVALDALRAASPQ